MFYDNLEKICKLRGTSISGIAKTIGLDKSIGSTWKRGASPSADIVLKLSEILEVSTDYLLKGKENSPAIKTGDISGSYNNLIGNSTDVIISLNGQAAALVDIFNTLTPINQAKLLIQASELKESENK